MASSETWLKVRKYFKADSTIDKWGSPSQIDDVHLLRLFDFRHWLGLPIYITHGVKSEGHSPSSWHYPRTCADGVKRSYATDIIIPDYQHSAFDLIMDATRFGFTGIGYYPHWRWAGERCGGLHLDSRPLKWDKDETVNYEHSRWLGVMELVTAEDGTEKLEQVYKALTYHNLMRYCAEIKDIDVSHLQ